MNETFPIGTLFVIPSTEGDEHYVINRHYHIHGSPRVGYLCKNAATNRESSWGVSPEFLREILEGRAASSPINYRSVSPHALG